MRVSVNFSDEYLDLVSLGFDMAIRIGSLTDSSLVARHLARNQRVLCASPDYLRKHGAPKTPADLEHHQCLVLVGSQGRQDVWRLSDAKGREFAVRVNGRLESNVGESLRDAAVAGLGIAVHSTWHICEELERGQLQVVLPRYSDRRTRAFTRSCRSEDWCRREYGCSSIFWPGSSPTSRGRKSLVADQARHHVDREPQNRGIEEERQHAVRDHDLANGAL